MRGRTAADRARCRGTACSRAGAGLGCRSSPAHRGAGRRFDHDSDGCRARVDQCDALFRRSVGPWRRVQPYGTWSSPITAPEVAAASPRLEGARFVGDELWWGEGIPEEGGRTAIRRRTADGRRSRRCSRRPGTPARACTSTAAARGRPPPDGTLYFVEKTDQRVWELTAGGQPRALTPPAEGARLRRPHLAGRAAAGHPRAPDREHPARAARSSRSAPTGCGSSSS